MTAQICVQIFVVSGLVPPKPLAIIGARAMSRARAVAKA